MASCDPAHISYAYHDYEYQTYRVQMRVATSTASVAAHLPAS